MNQSARANFSFRFLIAVIVAGGGGFVSAVDASAAENSQSQVKVLSRVAGHVITDRQVLREVFLENPELYVPGDRRKKVTSQNFDQALGRLITQIMVSEENRIVGLAHVSDAEIAESLAHLRQALGANYKRFLADFELPESELEQLLSEKYLLRKVLAAKMHTLDKKADGKPVHPETVIEDWLKQLRARYRVQSFREDSSAARP